MRDLAPFADRGSDELNWRRPFLVIVENGALALPFRGAPVVWVWAWSAVWPGSAAAGGVACGLWSSPMFAVLALAACLQTPAAEAAPPPNAPHALPAPPLSGTGASQVPDPTLGALLRASRLDRAAWDRLAAFCDAVGPRLAGSAGLVAAVPWVVNALQQDGLHAWTEKVMVPVWVRGEESLTVLAPGPRSLAILGLGGTVGTDGVEGSVIVVDSLDALGPQVKDKIVLINLPMADGFPNIRNYGNAVPIRVDGPALAAAQGARAVLIRSLTTRSLYTPHTGVTIAEPGQATAPAAAITDEDADWMARVTARGLDLRVRLTLHDRAEPDAESANVIAEIPGSEHPNEIVLIGAHLDSWDVGQGAHDDGAGVMHVLEAMRQIRALGVPPRRTIRAVLFTNEENGGRGGIAYAAAHGSERHIAAIESDLGGFRPVLWRAGGSAADLVWLRKVAAPLGLPIEVAPGGSDIAPLQGDGTLLIGLGTDDTRYFDIHHTNADTVDKVNPGELAEGVAAVAGLAWALANSPR